MRPLLWYSLFRFKLPAPHAPSVTHLGANLLLEDALESDSIGGELADTLTELLDGHLVLVEVEAEQSLVVDVRLLLEVEAGGLGAVKLLGDGLGGVEEVIKQVGLVMLEKIRDTRVSLE